MGYRRRPMKPSVALWLLVAVGDLALILASAGMAAAVALAGVVTIAVATVGAWVLTRRAQPEPVPARVRIPATTRRRV